ncbi:MAG: EutP/PduV family microcompartment system protein [Desulfobacterales bacterium]|nr:EutP/PduV family microcompartment system protein [Desulfobacterales bacterium]
MKKIMFIGKSGCGKTSLSQALHGQDITYLKTQAVKYAGMVVDTPGEFAENRRFYSALMVSAAKADIIGFVQDATARVSIFPPKFASMFKKEVIGIISKTDLDGSDIPRSERFLKLAGAGTILETSALERTGVARVLELLENDPG